MRSLLRFLLFVVIVGAAVGVLYFWRARQPVPPAPVSLAGRMPMLAALDQEFTTLVAQVVPSVVSIEAIPADAGNQQYQLLRMFLGSDPGNPPAESGSGVIVSDAGHILTNLHVISGAGSIQVQLADGRTLPARLVGSDSMSDIAILKVEATGLRALPFGNSDLVKVGQLVLAVGNPLGLQETVTQGIISARGRRASSEAANEFFQTDAAINPGNSGGPLVNLMGEIIGVNNAVSAQGQGIGFAIPSNTVKRVFESIRDYGRFIRPWFGAYMRTVTPELAGQLRLPDTAGVLVLLVYQGSPAEIGGLRRGDVILEFAGHPILDLLDLRNRVAETDIGQKVDLRIRREGKEQTIRLVIAAEPLRS